MFVDEADRYLCWVKVFVVPSLFGKVNCISIRDTMMKVDELSKSSTFVIVFRRETGTDYIERFGVRQDTMYF